MSPWKNSEYEWVCQWCYLKKNVRKSYVGRSTLEMGVDSAVISFNFGASRLLDVLKEYGLKEFGLLCIPTHFVAKWTYLESRKVVRKKAIREKHHGNDWELCGKDLGTRKKKGSDLFMDLVSVMKFFVLFYVLLVFKTIYLTVYFLKIDILQNSAVNNRLSILHRIFRKC